MIYDVLGALFLLGLVLCYRLVVRDPEPGQRAQFLSDDDVAHDQPTLPNLDLPQGFRPVARMPGEESGAEEEEETYIEFGEPLFSPVNRYAIILQVTIICAALLALLFVGERGIKLGHDWIVSNPLWSVLLAILCLVFSVALGAVRQAFAGLMATAAAIPILTDRGEPSM